MKLKAAALMVRLTGFVVVIAMSFGLGCSSAEKKPEDVVAPDTAMSDENILGDSDSGKAMGMQSIHFAFDSFLLDTEAKNILKTNAGILKDQASVKIQVEGHCDQTGGIQYNIALGEKRANAVKKYLQDLGISGDRITTISYGKERPLDPGTTEEAYAKNRRANFVITAR